MRTSTSRELSDSELMMQLGHGDNQALGEIYARYVSVVRSALTRSAPELPRAQRDELTQDVFLSLLELARPESARRYREEERLKAFLYGISVRKARMWRRQTWLRRHLLQRHADRPIAMAHAPEGDGSPAQRTEAREAVAQALALLPEAQREVLLLHAQGFSGDEIAGRLKIRPKTVWTRLHRARSALLAVALLSVGLCLISLGSRRSQPETAMNTRPSAAARTPSQASHPKQGIAAPASLTIVDVDASPRDMAEQMPATRENEARKNAPQAEALRTSKLSVRVVGSEQTAPHAQESVRTRKAARKAASKDALTALRRAVIEGRLTDAESGLRYYLEHSDRDAAAWSLLGDCQRKLGKWRASVAAYRAVIRVGAHADVQRARFLAASILQDRLQDPRAVIEMLEGYGEDQVAAPEARLRLARALLALGEAKRARATLESILTHQPASAIAQEARGLLDESARARP